MSAVVLRLMQFLLLVLPLAVFTGSKDNFLIKEIILVACVPAAFLIFLTAVIEKKEKFGLNRISAAFLAFLLAELLSVFNSKFPSLAFHDVLVHSCFLFSFILAVKYSSRRRELLDILLVSGFIVTVYGILQHFGIDMFSWTENYDNRPSSSLGNPDFFAGFLLILAPCAVSGYLTSGTKLKKYLCLFIALLSFIDLYLTQTRGAWLAFAVSLIYLFFSLKLYKNKLVSGALLAIFLVFLFTSTGYLRNKFNPAVPSVAERIFKWKTALEMIKEHPFLGVGAGNLKVNYALYQAKVRSGVKFRLKGTSESNVHNEFLQVWAETGTAGLICFILIFVFYFINRKTRKDPASVVLSSALAGFLAFCISNFPFRIIPTAFFAFILMGLTLNEQEIQKTRAPEITVNKKNLPLRIFFLLVYIFISWKFAIIPFTADISRRNGDLSARAGDFNTAIYQYQRAIRLDKVHSERTAFDLGELYRKLNRYDDALKAYEVSAQIRNYGEVYNCIANCYWLENDAGMALRNWETAAKLGMPEPKDQETVEKNILIARHTTGTLKQRRH